MLSSFNIIMTFLFSAAQDVVGEIQSAGFASSDLGMRCAAYGLHELGSSQVNDP